MLLQVICQTALKQSQPCQLQLAWEQCGAVPLPISVSRYVLKFYFQLHCVICIKLFQGVLDRFQQISPKVIFSVNAVHYNSKIHNHLDKLKQVANGLACLRHVIVIPFVAKQDEKLNISSIPKRLVYCYISQSCTFRSRQ